MADNTSTSSCCNASSCCPCECRIACLERRVRWMRWVLIVLGALALLLIGISIGKGPQPDRREAAMARMHARMPGGMGMRGGMPPMPMMRGMPGPDAMRGPDGPGPGDRGPDGPRGGDRRGDGPRGGGRGGDGPDRPN